MLRHNQRNELAFFLEHPDFANRSPFGIRRLDIFGLNFLPTLGFDQRRDTAKDMKITVSIDITHVAGAKPPIVGEDLVGFVREIPITGKDIRPARQNFADLVFVIALPFFERFGIDAGHNGPDIHDLNLRLSS